jgi:MGT family glycosyltransferase
MSGDAEGSTRTIEPRSVLFVMWQGGGNVPVQLGVARRLLERGHRVRVLADPAVEVEARETGCDFAAFRRAPRHNLRSREEDIFRDWEHRSGMRQVERLFETVMFAPAQDYACDVLDELARFPADVVAVDSMLLGAQIGAEASGVPTAVLWHMAFTRAAGIPPPGLGLRPARTSLGRLRDRALRTFMTRFMDARGLGPVNQARASIGLAPLTSVDDQLARADRVLVLSSPSFDFPASALPPNVRYVGPQLDDPVWAAPWTNPWPDQHPDPLVLVSFGSTFQDQAAVIRRTIEAVKALPARGLVTLADVVSPRGLPTADNVVTTASAPHAQVLPAASAVVTHGGHGTVLKALAHGVPVLCIPQGRDQIDNAARVEAAGAGIRLKTSARSPTIRRSIRRLLETPSYRAAAQRLATAIDDETRADAATHELETLASTSPPSPDVTPRAPT